MYCYLLKDNKQNLQGKLDSHNFLKGILLALAKRYKLPIIALGLGEKEDDLQIFNAEKFAKAFTQIN